MKRPHLVIVAACGVGMALGFTAVFAGALPTLMKEMAAAHGWSRTQVAAGASVATLAAAVGTPIVGRLIDSFGSRRVSCASTLLLALLLYVFSMQTGSLALYLVLAGVIGLCAVGTTPFAYLTLMARWFDQRLGAAMGVAALGMGLGFAAAPLVAAKLSQAFGWRGAWQGLALIAAVGFVNALLFIREPADPRHAGMAAVDTATGLSLAEAARTRAFWLICGAIFLISVSVNSLLFHLVPLLTDRGQALEAAARVSAAMGAAVIVTRLLVGVLLDRLPTPLIAASAFTCGAGGIALLAGGAGGAVPLLAALCLGVAFGAEADIMPYACRRHFGLRAYGQIYGVVIAVFTLGVVIGPMAMALVYDRQGSYAGALPVLAILSLLAAAAIAVLGRPAYGPRQPTAEPSFGPAIEAIPLRSSN